MTSSIVEAAQSLEQLEVVIERGLQTFIEVGLALREIKDRKLYLKNYDNFEEYCGRRWEMSKQSAYSYIAASQVIENIQNSVQTFGQNPLGYGQAIELSVLTPEQQTEVANRVDFSNTTVRELHEIVTEKKQESDPCYRKVGSSDNEWYTPAKYLIAARKVMGGIDLDPASCDRAQETVDAAQYFTRENSGLNQPWRGRVWLNPPYSGGEIFPFVQKLLNELESGAVEQAILLTNNSTDTAWFHMAEELASLICFTRGRIEFESSNGANQGTPTSGQTFFYFGPNNLEFRQYFSDFGFIR